VRNELLTVGVFAAVLTVCFAGCSSDGSGVPLGQVEGTVTMNDAPLAGVEVEFQPAEGSPSYGTTDEEGHYVLKFTEDEMGAMIGEHTVRLNAGVYEDEDGEEIETDIEIPANYNEESTLTFTVEKGSQTADWPLKSE
jgi:hypothetical protein